MSNFDITSANAEATLIIDEIYPSGIQLQMFGTDSSLAMDAIDISESRKGVDGKMVSGYVPVIYPLTVTLEAASPSYGALTTLWEAMVTNRKVYKCTLVCTIPSIGMVFTWANGVLKNGTPFPDMKKTLEPTTWNFEFQDFGKSSI